VLEAHRFVPKNAGETTDASSDTDSSSDDASLPSPPDAFPGRAAPLKENKAYPATAPLIIPQTSQFKQDLDQVVAAHFAGKGRMAHKASAAHMLLCAGFFLAELVCWAGWFRGDWACAALLPVFFWLTAVNVSHDASHMAFSSKGWVNEICTFAAMPLLYEPSTWYYQHVISHHIHTNHAEVDVDLQHFAPLKFHGGDKRPHPLGDAKWPQYLKVVGVPFHLCMFVPFNQIDELRMKIYNEHFAPAVWIPAGLKPFLRHRLKSTAAVVLNFALIIYSFAAFGLAKGLLFVLIPWGGCSILFLIYTQVSHIQPDVQEAELQEQPDFFKRQATTSVDYWTTSAVARVMSGGLNTQALHHSLPYVSSCHYSDLYPAFQLVCARHGVELKLRRGLFHAVSTCCRHVWNVNGGWDIMSRGTF